MEKQNWDTQLSPAVVLYLGYGRAQAPVKDESQLRAKWSPPRAHEMVRQISAILHDLQAINIDWSVHTLQSAGKYAKQALREKYPDLTEEALCALEWKFTFDWR